MHDSGAILKFIVSIQIVITQARNSREFRGVLISQSGGILKVHVFPEIIL